MAETEIIDITSSNLGILGSGSVSNTLNAVYGIKESGSALSSKYSPSNHDHSTIGKASGTNGYYIRFNDGVQICWARLPLSSQTMTTNNAANVYGGMYANVTFPAAFNGKPIVMSDCVSTIFSNTQVSGVTSSSCVIRHWSNYSVGGGAVSGIELTYIAIGRWY